MIDNQDLRWQEQLAFHLDKFPHQNFVLVRELKRKPLSRVWWEHSPTRDEIEKHILAGGNISWNPGPEFIIGDIDNHGDKAGDESWDKLCKVIPELKEHIPTTLTPQEGRHFIWRLTPEQRA